MAPIEILLEIAKLPGEVGDLTRSLIGNDVLAMLIAKAGLSGTSQALSPTHVAEVLGISRNTASDRIDLASVKAPLIKP
jgi:hypothetical protein